MQDFTKDASRKTDAEILANKDSKEKVESIKSEVVPNLTSQPILDLIKSRMNKDNIWNLVFWIGTSIMVWVAQLLILVIPGGAFVFFATVIFTPYLITRFNKVVYKDDMFVSTATKRELCKYMPMSIGFMIWLGIPFTTFWIFFIHDKYPVLDENFCLYNMIFWFIPTLYCILKNLPISIIFNKTAWAKVDPAVVAKYNINNHHSSRSNSDFFANTSSINRESIVTSSRYRYMSCNIYHRK